MRYVGAAHKYMYTPIREAWPASVVNARIPPVPLLDTSGQRSTQREGQATIHFSQRLAR